jgi:hypothetical protein
MYINRNYHLSYNSYTYTYIYTYLQMNVDQLQHTYTNIQDAWTQLKNAVSSKTSTIIKPPQTFTPTAYTLSRRHILSSTNDVIHLHPPPIQPQVFYEQLPSQSQTQSKKEKDYIDMMKQKPFELRRSISSNIMNKHPDRICIIVERDKKSPELPKIQKHKFLVPVHMTLHGFMIILRNRIQLPEHQSFYLIFNNGHILSNYKQMNDIYSQHADEDGFLYCRYCSENVFG